MIMLDRLVEQPTWKLESVNDVDYSNVPILTITVMESLELDSWIRGGEFLLTSTHTLSINGEKLNTLISDLKNLRVSALAIKIGDEESEIPQTVIENSEKLHFPIFLIPNTLTYLEIMNPINSQIFYENKMDILKERIFSYLILNENLNDPVLHNIVKVIDLNLSDQHIIAVSIYPHERNDFSVKELERVFNKFYVKLSDIQQTKIIDTFLFLRNINSIDFLLISTEKKLKNLNIFKLLYSIKKKPNHYEDYKIGVSSIKSITETNLAVEEAIFSVQINEVVGDSTTIDFEQVKIYKLIHDIYGDETSNFIQDTLKGVLNNKNLMETLQVYFQQNERLKDTSEELYIHINTLHYRLNKIELETGLKLAKMSEKVRLYLATISYMMLRKRGRGISDEYVN
ncbi:PucR family transcriptional regulator [Amphibacillus sp. Q70]|uniref:PucR family transcriptional regulator n=1 Tax=Amphibacillus sp. Q70 TaxID=3453416 RepID=UPI003F82471B